MSLIDKISEKKRGIQANKKVFLEKLNQQGALGKAPELPYVMKFPAHVNLPRLMKPLIGTYVNRWTTYKTSNQCSEKFMRSDLYPQYRELFFHAWGVVRLFVPEGKLLRAGAAATIAYDLKVLHRISTELGDE